MNGILVGIDRRNNERMFRVLLYTRQLEGNKTQWNFKQKYIDEKSLAQALYNKQLVLDNGELSNSKSAKELVVGKGGALSRFENKVNKPLVVLSVIVDNNGRVLGNKVATYDGKVRNINNKELLAYCARENKKGGIPIQNMQYVSENGEQSAHIRSYPGYETYKEVYIVNKSSKVVKAKVDKEENKKALSKIEEIFDKDQIKELKLGKEHGVNIRIYGNPKISADKMEVLRTMLEEGLNAEVVADPRYSVEALEMLMADMKYGTDITYYCRPDYNLEQLFQLSLAYESGVDISKLADPKNSAEEMSEIRTRLENDLWMEHFVEKDKLWINSGTRV